ncbi:hypothetical protein Dsin_005783 [Dipteronia sinensis]|uniref:CBS domain-containing protein n=1 Tax=Dipteronia sinensis TaxID=43782 RepID=A0AAE0EF08_9ROSI|nr:hypothetical protein Dsin_005783 [Dipteronia sinensis]
MSPSRSPIELFTFQNSVKSTENTLVVHRLGLSSFSFRVMVDSLGSRGVRAEAAIRAIGEFTEFGISIWRRKPLVGIKNSEMGQQRFVGILNSLDIVSFLAKSECLEDQKKAMKTPVSEVVVPNGSLLRQVDPGTRALILGLKYALKKWFKHIRVHGDSMLMCMQMVKWKRKVTRCRSNVKSQVCDVFYDEKITIARQGLNVYIILLHNTLVMSRAAVNKIVVRMHTPVNH